MDSPVITVSATQCCWITVVLFATAATCLAVVWVPPNEESPRRHYLGASIQPAGHNRVVLIAGWMSVTVSTEEPDRPNPAPSNPSPALAATAEPDHEHSNADQPDRITVDPAAPTAAELERLWQLPSATHPRQTDAAKPHSLL
jgi:hypothetical protein